jgi:hypothetical protein
VNSTFILKMKDGEEITHVRRKDEIGSWLLPSAFGPICAGRLVTRNESCVSYYKSANLVMWTYT